MQVMRTTVIVRVNELDSGFEHLIVSICPARTNFMKLSLRTSQMKVSSSWAMERSLDTAACLGSNDLDGLRADCLDSGNPVADNRDDLEGAAAR